MNDLEIMRLVTRTVRQMVQQTVMGQVVSNESQTRSTIKRFSNESPRDNTRVLMPFGVSSKAPVNTQSLVSQGGADPSNQNVLGHFDEARPQTADGESCLYNAFGQAIYMSNGKIKVGSNASSEPVVLGEQLKDLLGQILDLIAQHTHAGPGAPPSNAPDFTQLKSNIDIVLSKLVFTE